MEQDDNTKVNVSEKEILTSTNHSENPAAENKDQKKKKKKTKTTMGGGGENRCTRFSDEQVKLLESVFSQAKKLEPRKKVELANDIGLHPRQVSIWFQNKRARWKSKQMENEYRVLKHDFDALNQKFQSLKKENHSLLQQIQTLKNLFEKNRKENDDVDVDDDDEKSSSCRGLWSDEDDGDGDDVSGIEKYLRKNYEKQEIEMLQFMNNMQTDDENGRNSTSLASVPADNNWCDLPVPVSSVADGFSEDPSTWWN